MGGRDGRRDGRRRREVERMGEEGRRLGSK